MQFDVELLITRKTELSNGLCNIPQKIASKIHSDSVVCCQITHILHGSEKSKITTPLLYLWTGGVSATNHIEICDSAHYKLDSSSSRKWLGYNEQVVVKVIVQVPDVTEVLLSPCTDYDWDIACTQAHYIESNLLKTLCFVMMGQTVKINVGQSISASFKVLDMKYSSQTKTTKKTTTYDNRYRVGIGWV